MATHVFLDGKRWTLGEEIGDRGGFGRVHAAVSPAGDAAAIKFVPKDPGADRELLFARDLEGIPNVIPVWAAGEHGDELALAMPRAEMSLRDRMLQAGGPLPPDEVVRIASAVATALAALAARDRPVVHRDLKPENVLLRNGGWRLADFGIARYAEASTATATMKFAKTRPYAAPEQWREERATPAADVYALGVTAHEMLAGALPFPGPDFRGQHLERPSPPLPGVADRLAGLVKDCLAKPPGARPPASEVLERLRSSAEPADGVSARLRSLNLGAARDRERELAEDEARRTDDERRRGLYEAAREAMDGIREAMRARLAGDLPMAGREWPFELNGAKLEWPEARPVPRDAWGSFPPAFDVIAESEIRVAIPPPAPEEPCSACDAGTCLWHYEPHRFVPYAGRSHALWYCDAQEAGVFRWFETAFMGVRKYRQTEAAPVSLPCGEDAGGALSRTLWRWQPAWRFTPLDRDGATAFAERWLGWFADAAEGSLSRPDRMPEHDGIRNSYRRS